MIYTRRTLLLYSMDILFLTIALFICLLPDGSLKFINWFLLPKMTIYVLIFKFVDTIYPRGYYFKKGVVIEKRFFSKKRYLIESSEQITIKKSDNVVIISGKGTQKKLYIDPRKYDGNMIEIIEEIYY